MKVIQINHPDSTYPDLIEAVWIKLSQDYKLHSTTFLPGQIQGTGTLTMFFEEKPRFKLLEFKARQNDNEQN
jgi:hypothetical protein